MSISTQSKNYEMFLIESLIILFLRLLVCIIYFEKLKQRYAECILFLIQKYFFSSYPIHR